MNQNPSLDQCPRCGLAHPIKACPQVKRIEYDTRGNLASIEFHPAGEEAREKSVAEQMQERGSAASSLYTKDARGGL